MKALPVIVVVDHQGSITRELTENLSGRANVVGVDTVSAAEVAMIRHPADVLICRDDLPGEPGLMFLSRYRESLPWQKRILLCPEVTGDLAIRLINESSVFRCLAFPGEPGLLTQATEAALQDSTRLKELMASREETRELRQQLAAARQAKPTTFLTGLRALPRILTVAAITCGAIFALGFITLLALYAAKTLLGIDLFPDAHLRDVLPN